MADQPDILARIDAAREAVAEARNHVAHFPLTEGDAVRVTRLADILESLIPESPTDDERDAVLATVKSAWHSNQRARGAWVRDDANRGRYPGNEFEWITDAIMASPEWRNRGRGPITDDTVEHYCVIMHDAYESAASREGWTTQEASRKPWADVPDANKRTMRVAVRAVLEAARDAEAGR